MISRRDFIAGTACTLGCGHASAGDVHRTFLCATPDVPDSRIEPSATLNASRVAYRRAAPDPKLLWKISDGATPGTGLITLNVHFVNGTSAEHEAVANLAAGWTKGRLGRRIAFRFGRPARQSQVRVGFNGGSGNVSSIGRSSLTKGSHEPTVNLDKLLGSGEQETQRAVLHEFGHVLGLHHEHQHPKAGIVWNKKVVRAEMHKRHWSDAKIQANIFDHLSRNCTCIGDPEPDPNSIMLYPFPASWVRSGIGSAYNIDISARDRACLVREYRV